MARLDTIAARLAAADRETRLQTLLEYSRKLPDLPDRLRAARAQGEEAKAQLRANTEAAIAAGVYGVPTLAFGGDLFWGNDAHAFALAALRNPALLDDPEMQRVGTLPVGVQRR